MSIAGDEVPDFEELLDFLPESKKSLLRNKRRTCRDEDMNIVENCGPVDVCILL